MIQVKTESILSLITSMFEYAQFKIEKLFKLILMITVCNCLCSIMFLIVFGGKSIILFCYSVLILIISMASFNIIKKVIGWQKVKVTNHLISELDRIEVEKMLEEIDE